ncbi:MAG: DUF4158 domain-containing protein [Pseudomonadota bacterium]
MRCDTSDGPGIARLLYPELPDPVSREDLQRLFRPSHDECRWAPTVARTPGSQVALLVQLEAFQFVGRFLRVEEIPSLIVECVANRLGVEGGACLMSSDRQRRSSALPPLAGSGAPHELPS